MILGVTTFFNVVTGERLLVDVGEGEKYVPIKNGKVWIIENKKDRENNSSNNVKLYCELFGLDIDSAL